ncbi:TPA: hypothetical protein CPT81_07725 [Candidatus Gastranaerophilales bacterium HUM_20]|nr:MAG TPA: hypothetical protein CPT81_07725 [Candidatus Gastranaerophilales bacterium HUM_20]
MINKIIKNKFLILTFDWSLNYGATLQAYALQQSIKRLGIKADVLRYTPLRNIFDDCLDTRELFRKKYLSRTKECYTESELKNILSKYDGVIIGGDQVFRNFNWYEKDLPLLRYFGDFITGKKLIASYAASFGLDYFDGDDYLKTEVKKLLNRFDKIAVREKSGIEILKNTFEVDGTEVLDPVFLLSAEDYAGLIDDNKNISPKNDYIAYMYLGEDNGKGDINKHLLNSINSHFVNINWGTQGDYNTVEQWLNYVKHSKFVITDSFHCLAFAIIFRKPFIVVKRDFGGNARIDNILEKLNLQYCARNSLEDITASDLNLEINYNDVYKIIEREKQISLNYLKELLNIKPGYKKEYRNEPLAEIRKEYEINYKKQRKNKIQKFFKSIFSVSNYYTNYKKYKIIRFCGIKIKFSVAKLNNKETQTPIAIKNELQNYKTVQYVVAMLKAYGIKNIISSPGCQNAMFNLIVQEDDFFNCISVTDERSAAFMATGIAEQTGEPVVITCTGSSASRNWIPALTEAYYRNLPIIAMPFYNRASHEFNMAAQFIDRKVTQNDIKTLQIKLDECQDAIDRNKILTYLNAGLFQAKYNNTPVIIECPSILDFSAVESYRKLPTDIWSTIGIDNAGVVNNSELQNKKIAVYIGSHRKFTQREEKAISDFAVNWNIPVFCDYTSHYHGKNKVLAAKAVICRIQMPDLILDIGDVTGDYFAKCLFDNAEIWRITKNKTFKARYDYPVAKTFLMGEPDFFEKMSRHNLVINYYYSNIKEKIDKFNVDNLPLCNYFVIEKLSKYIPNNSILHHGVSNTKRGMNFYEFDESIDITCNVGVCGIDGAVSTLVGQSIAKPDKKCFGIFGDLTFFYDMNVLQQRAIRNNLRILLINNNNGVEFKVGGFYARIREKTDKLIASAGHHTKAEGWAKDCGFEYISAISKEEFLSKINDFCNKPYSKPVLFEVFTQNEEEIKSLDMMLGGISD